MPFSLDLIKDVQDLVQDVQDKFPTQNSASNQSAPSSTSGGNNFGNNFGLSQDFAFLINIIKTLEKTIEALNKRLEAYENQTRTQTQNVTIIPIEQRIKTVNENQNAQKDAEVEEKNDGNFGIKTVHEKQGVQKDVIETESKQFSPEKKYFSERCLFRFVVQ